MVDDEKKELLVEILSTPTNPAVLQVCIGKNEQQHLMRLCNEIERSRNGNYKESINGFVQDYLTRNKHPEHSCDIIRFIIACYNTKSKKNNKNGSNQSPEQLPSIQNKDTFVFN